MPRTQTTADNERALTISEVMTFLPDFIKDEGEDRVPLCIWSPPGVGKSRMVEQACQIAGYECKNWMRASQMEPIDVRGAPDLLHSNGGLKWYPPSWFPETGVKTVLFFDELGQGTQGVQAAMMQAILEFCVGENKFSDDTCVIAASNREGDRSGVIKMLAALSSRFTHIDLVPDIDSWLNWAYGHGIDPRLIAFLRLRGYPSHDRPGLLHDFDPKLRSSPNPRSWERLSKILAKGLGAKQELALASGTVGEGAAIEVTAYLGLLKKGMPDLTALLLNPKGSAIPQSTDVQVAVASGMAAMATEHNFGAVIQYTERLGAELNMFSVSGATTRDPQLCNTAAYQRWAIENQRLHV